MFSQQSSGKQHQCSGEHHFAYFFKPTETFILQKEQVMWQIKKLPFYIDLIFCLVLLPAMMTLLPIERWLINNSLFVYLLVSWLYIVYILNRRFIMPFMFAGKNVFG